MATRATTVQITMPQMGESVTEGTVLEWLKQVGDRVEAEEPIVEISTDKVDAEVPAPAAGTLVRILAEPDSTVQVGEVLGEIESGGEPPADTAAIDDPLVEISTDKVDAEVPSPVAGTIAEVLVEADQTVGVGTILCR